MGIVIMARDEVISSVAGHVNLKNSDSVNALVLVNQSHAAVGIMVTRTRMRKLKQVLTIETIKATNNKRLAMVVAVVVAAVAVVASSGSSSRSSRSRSSSGSSSSSSSSSSRYQEIASKDQNIVKLGTTNIG